MTPMERMHPGLAAENDRLRALNAELVAVLQFVLADGIGTLSYSKVQAMRAAIAKAKAQP